MYRILLFVLLVPLLYSQEQSDNDVTEITTTTTPECTGSDCEDSELLNDKNDRVNNKVTANKVKVKEKTVLSDEVLHKFKVLMENLFDSSHNRDFFQILASERPLAIFRLPTGSRVMAPPEQRLFTTPDTFSPFGQNKTSSLSRPLENPRDPEQEREYLRETSYQQPEQSRTTWTDYERYWRQYYDNAYSNSQPYYNNYNYRPSQQQQPYYYDTQRNPYNYYSNPPSYSSYGPQNPYQYQSQYGPQQQYKNPYYSSYYPNYYQNYNQNQGLGLQSGLNVGLGNGVGFGISSGFGFNMGR
ncbi:unnamed protein product [Bursaphelenchus okinawaensis]|uniref:Uncharacterized protein n=1 Tax=Bursaphelenchus okinawaensis TaxID=465554 RepID=A0A811K7U4_9BILA|nr:unnamed protein product [Bursaphelenchus okinawaensis]CAG9093521.1 unnamed protein product [Bursaphelenchus okinawaensis]